MPITILMPALSPTMEKGNLAKWLVKAGDTIKSGQVLAEIETDKATMEFEAVDEGLMGQILVADGTDDVEVGTPIAVLLEEGETAVSPSPPAGEGGARAPLAREGEGSTKVMTTKTAPPPQSPPATEGQRILASPLARRLAAQAKLDLRTLNGSGPGGRIVKADIEAATLQQAQGARTSPLSAQAELVEARAAKPPVPMSDSPIPHEVIKLSLMRKTIAGRLTESKQQVPHIYLSVDIRLDALLKLRGELNDSLKSRGIKLSVNDMLIKALGVALTQVPKCNVSFAGDTMLMYSRADISVAVSVPNGLITPIITDAGNKSVSTVSSEMTLLAGKAKEGKLQPHEYQGGTASLSNMGMMGIKQFEAVINPPQAMIMAIGAGEKRPYVIDDALAIATVMTATGSFDHRAIDGADGAELMAVFKNLIEKPLGLVA